MTGKTIEGELVPRRPGDEGRAAEGDYLEAGGPGLLDDAHAPEARAQELLGKDPQLDELSAEWVITRLMREATDYGKRSRQTARVAALGMLAKATGLLGEENNPLRQPEDAVQKALEMTPEERRRLIAERVRQLVERGELNPEELKKSRP